MDAVVRERLRSHAAQDVRELLAHLDARGRALAEGARIALGRRAEQEAGTMAEIIEAQRRRVAEAADKYRDPQMSFDFDEEESRQLESNRRHWGKRLAALDRERETEPERIRSIYEVRARRIEPVGLVYLWPITG